jgi:hypothetical protein
VPGALFPFLDAELNANLTGQRSLVVSPRDGVRI